MVSTYAAQFLEPVCVDDEPAKGSGVLTGCIVQIVIGRRAQAQTRGWVQARVIEETGEQRINGIRLDSGQASEPGLKFFFSPCQHSKYSCCRTRVSIANFVGRTTSCVSNMKASVLAR
jgi:hypothetical protein